MRRNAVQVIARFRVVAFILALPFGLPAVITGAISLGFPAFITLVVAIFFNGLQWVGHKVLCGGTPEYEELRANGLDPWFDVSCPPPLFGPNPSSLPCSTRSASRRRGSSVTVWW